MELDAGGRGSMEQNALEREGSEGCLLFITWRIGDLISG